MRSFATALLLVTSASAFVSDLHRNHRCGIPLQMTAENNYDFSLSSRRGFMVSVGAITGALGLQQSALAIPMVTVDELGIILRDSPYSVKIVEFSGPKAETITVKLVDGTSFGLKDIVESSTDPRSPLKVSAACREAGVKTKFVDLEELLTKSKTKKKLYTNERVQAANTKTKEQEERMRQDEVDRLEALQKMEEEGAAAAAAATKTE